MKTYTLLFSVLFCFIVANTSAQKKVISANSNKETIKTGGIEIALNSKTFEFIANTMYPTSGTPKNLVGSDYSVSFSPEMIISNLPFYGRAYRGMTMGRDKGMRFKGKPENFNIEKKKEYQVNTVVKDGDTYEMTLLVSDSGYASLTISSNNRGTISYRGEVVNISE